jgi:hypothetical protein
MIVDTSPNRVEWYEEYYEPDVPKLSFAGSVDPVVLKSLGKRAGKQAAIIAAAGQQAVSSIGTHLHGALVAFDRANKQSNYTLFPQPLDETVRERALRLAKQPHSMAQDPDAFHFDRRGRRRY